MRLLQVIDQGQGPRLGLLDGASVRILKARHAGVETTLDLLVAVAETGLRAQDWARSAEAAGAFRVVAWEELGKSSSPRLTLPLSPPEVWGAGVTYRRSADFREEGTGIYDRVYDAPRPELFFKASARRCVGPGEAIGRRRDSAFTASEPELAVVLSKDGTVLGYTLANDVSAWDIERENPLYLPQSKVYDGCFALGPVIVTPDEVKDAHALELTCQVSRGGRVVFEGAASTSQLKRPISELVSWLLRSNTIRTGTVLSTGTGIIQPMDVGLEEGDVVTITCPEIGALRNPVALV